MRIWFVALREMRQLRRDRRTLFVFLAVPVVLVVLFGYALSFNVRNIRLAVLDQDRSTESRRLIESFVQSGRFTLVADLADEDDLQAALDRGYARAGLRISPRFSQDLGTDREAAVLVVVDGSDPQTANSAASFARSILAAHSSRLAREAVEAAGGSAARLQPMDGQVHFWYNPDLRDPLFMLPGLVGVITNGLTMVLTAFSLVRERELGTYEQLIVTPLSPAEIVFGKLMPYALIASLNAVVVIASACLFFDVPIRGSIPLLAALTFLFVLGSLGIGLFVSTMAQTQAQAFPVIIVTYLPNVLLTGFVFPIAAMPPMVQEWTQFVPLTHYLTIVRGIMLKGNGVEAFIPELTYLTVFCLGILLLSTALLRKKIG